MSRGALLTLVVLLLLGALLALAPQDAPPSFLQVRSPEKSSLVGIRSQIEDALSHKKDTHGILMRIQEALKGQAATSPDAENVRQVTQGDVGAVEGPEGRPSWRSA